MAEDVELQQWQEWTDRLSTEMPPAIKHDMDQSIPTIRELMASFGIEDTDPVLLERVSAFLYQWQNRHYHYRMHEGQLTPEQEGVAADAMVSALGQWGALLRELRLQRTASQQAAERQLLADLDFEPEGNDNVD